MNNSKQLDIPKNLFLTIPWHEPHLSDNEEGCRSVLKIHESPLASLQNIDIGRTPSTQVETNIHPSMTELPPQGFVEDSPKEELITGNKRQIETVTSMDSTDTYAKWRKLTLVAQSIQRFRSLKVERVKSETCLRSIINNTPYRQREDNNKGIMYITPNEMHKEALDSFRDNSDFFNALEIAGKRELAMIRRALINDPKENFYDEDSPQRLVNRPNHRGYTPLYIACKNGNIELLKLLIEFKANPYQLCKISSKQRESVLKVAVRWGHFDIVEYLLSPKFDDWPEKELRSAYEEANSSQMKRILKDRVEKLKRPFLQRFFSCH